MVSHDESRPWIEFGPGRFWMASDDLAIRVSGQEFKLTAPDHELVRFLDLIVYARQVDRDISITPRSLLVLRNEFWRIVAQRPISGLVKCLAARLDIEELRLAVWLLGKCGNDNAIPVLFDYRSRCSPGPLKRSFERALRRLGANSENRLSDLNLDLRRRPLERDTPRDFNQVLKKLLGTTETPIPAPQRTFELLVPIGPDAPVPPKSRHLIRRFLEHIRWLLRSAV